MIARLRGILAEARPTEVVIDVHGVGYRVHIPLSTFDRLPREGGEAMLRICLHVREDAMELYGFATPEEQQLFELLQTVTGVGARLALNILSTTSVNGFCAAVRDGDVKLLSQLKGIGKKTAERLVLELKGKIQQVAPAVALGGTLPEGTAQAVEEAKLALVQLGFRHEDAAALVRDLARELPTAECSSENLIRRALGAMQQSAKKKGG
jgi:Holliday junction DNA helicase RuvA